VRGTKAWFTKKKTPALTGGGKLQKQPNQKKNQGTKSPRHKTSTSPESGGCAKGVAAKGGRASRVTENVTRRIESNQNHVVDGRETRKRGDASEKKWELPKRIL